jgi:hypothetical protein
MSCQLKCRLAYVDMKIGLLPDRRRTPTGPPPDAHRTQWNPAFTALERLEPALDPGFHCVPAGPTHPERDADGVDVA